VQEDFVLTDNGVPQQITHFAVGGDPVSLVIVIETSSRVDPLLPQLRRTGILLTEQVMGPEAEAAVLGFDESVDKLQDFTRSHDAIQSVFAGLRTGESGQHLFDAMAAGVEMLTGRREPGAVTQVTGRRVLLVKFFAALNWKTSPSSASDFPPLAASCRTSPARTSLLPSLPQELTACPDPRALFPLPVPAITRT
jgi:hypothetical protein